jgi:hypothetical protein
MSKNTERARILESIKSNDFESDIEKLGFTIHSSAEEAKTKKKASI